MADVGADESAFPVRDAEYCFNIVAAWDDPRENDQHIGWAHRTYDALEPSARGGGYVNFINETGSEAVRRAYDRTTFERLQGVKAKYDPDNIFCINQNIPPSTG
jgi:FAD/FMN-containing dehydrogenase